MPKINMYSHPNPDGTDGSRRIELGYRPKNMGGSVQIGVTAIAAGAEEFRDREYFGGTETEPAKPVWQGQFLDLERDQINQLIQHLREVRDRAFGRDQ